MQRVEINRDLDAAKPLLEATAEVPVGSTKRCEGIMKRTMLLLLCIQFTAFTLTRATFRSRMCDAQIMGMSEVIKGGVAASMSFRRRTEWFVGIGSTLVPVVCFVIMNLLSLWAMRHLSAGASTVLMQMKLPMTVWWSRVLLGKRVSFVGLLLVMLIVDGSIGIAVGETDMFVVNSGSRRASATAAFALTCETFLSGFAVSYMELLFCTSHMWVRNVQMSCASLVLYGIWVSINTDSCNVWRVDVEGGALATLGAAGGLLVALTLKHVGATEKTMVVMASVVLTSVVEAFLRWEAPSLHFVTHAICVLISVYAYAHAK